VAKREVLSHHATHGAAHQHDLRQLAGDREARKRIRQGRMV